MERKMMNKTMFKVKNGLRLSVSSPMTIKEVEVSAGRLYLTETNGSQERYFKNPETDKNGNKVYVQQDSVYTAADVLYETKEAAEQWVTRETLIKELNNKDFRSLSIHTIRKILEIVNTPDPVRAAPRDVLEKDLVSLFTNGKIRYVHFMGYCYQTEGQYRCVEYVGNCIKLKHVLEHPEYISDQFNEIYNNDHSCQISDITEKELMEYYTDPDTGELYQIVSRTDLDHLEDGVYII